MFLYGFIFSCDLLLILIHAQNANNINNAQRSIININVNEHELKSKNLVDSSHEETWKTSTEKTLIRVPRINTKTEELQINQRQRRQIIEIVQTAGVVISIAKALKKTKSGEEILGVAKKVAITIIVIISLCILCCCITTVVLCIKCCGGGNNRKRNEGSVIQPPQTIYIQPGQYAYQPQQFQQQAPPKWNSMSVESPESRPMLPQPSAPPRPMDDFSNENAPPPPYEKLYSSS